MVFGFGGGKRKKNQRSDSMDSELSSVSDDSSTASSDLGSYSTNSNSGNGYSYGFGGGYSFSSKGSPASSDQKSSDYDSKSSSSSISGDDSSRTDSSSSSTSSGSNYSAYGYGSKKQKARKGGWVAGSTLTLIIAAIFVTLVPAATISYIGYSKATSNEEVIAPIGSILAYAGPIANIPTNWHLCDGTNGTPNLVNKFIRGTDTDALVGSTGGADSVGLTLSNLPQHQHSTPAHSHSYDYAGLHTNRDIGIMGVGGAPRGIEVNSWGTRQTSSASPNTGNVIGGAAGQAFATVPQHVTLAYIMRTG